MPSSFAGRPSLRAAPGRYMALAAHSSARGTWLGGALHREQRTRDGARQDRMEVVGGLQAR
jgi:hypothetical protein